MKIRSKIPNEPNGREVDLGTMIYRFKPNARGDNVCEVADKAHVGVLLAIREGYEIYDGDDVAPGAKAVPAKPKAGGKDAPAGGVRDPLASSQTVDTDNEPVPTEAELRSERRRGDSDRLADLNAMSRKELIAAYEQKFGKKPARTVKDAALIQKLLKG